VPDTDPTPIGPTLRTARKRKGLEVSQAARVTGLHWQTIVDLESADHEALVSDVRLLAALRVYARQLDLDPEPLIASAYQVAGPPPPAAGAEPPPPPPPEGHGRPPMPALIAVGVVAALIAAVIGVGVTSSRSEPAVTLTAPPATPEDDEVDLDLDDEDDDEGDDGNGDNGDDGNGDNGDNGNGGGDEDADDEGDDDEGDEADEDEAGREDDGEGDASIAGRPPEETRVQLLNGSGDGRRLEEAEAALRELGYDVREIDSTLETWDTSTVFHTSGWEEEAQGLHDRDARFEVGGKNPGFEADVSLHVIVGSDWPE
jgi:hypothetical protein